jgi:hypothetical protein
MVKTREEWQRLCLQKIETAKRLIGIKEWAVAGDIMGYALECALKAATCKTLNNRTYPPVKINPKDGSESSVGIKTSHELDTLLVFSGLSNVFNSENFTWGQINSYYPGAWNERRYEIDLSSVYNEDTVNEIAKLLYDGKESIIQTLQRGDRW